MIAKPAHLPADVRAMLAQLDAPPASDLDAWLRLAHEAAKRAPCGWCGGDGTGILILDVQDPNGSRILKDLSGCPACRGKGTAGEGARGLLGWFKDKESGAGGALGLLIALDRRAKFAVTPAPKGDGGEGERR